MVFFVSCELLGKEGGKRLILTLDEPLFDAFLEITRLPFERLTKILNFIAELNLISLSAWKQKRLYCPELKHRVDEYTVRLRREARVSREKVVLDKNRREQIRTEYIKAKGWSEEDLGKDDYARINKAINTLYPKAHGNVEEILKGIYWIAAQNFDFDWKLETLAKMWPRYMKEKKVQAYQNKPKEALKDCEFCKGRGVTDSGRPCICLVSKK